MGIEGFGLDLPAQRLRMPTLQLPSLVRYARQPRFQIDAAEAAFVRNVATEFTFPAGNDVNGGGAGGPAGGPAGNPAGSCNAGSPGGAPAGCTDGRGAAAGSQSDVYSADGQMPPLPRIERAAERDVPHPDFSRSQQPGHEQIVRDPATGKFYKVVMQEVPQPVPDVSQRELQLAQELNEQRRRADEVQAKLSRLESLIERIADNQNVNRPIATNSAAGVELSTSSYTAVTGPQQDLFGPPAVFSDSAFSTAPEAAAPPTRQYEAIKTSYQAPASGELDASAQTESRTQTHHAVAQPVTEVRPGGDNRLGGKLKQWFAFGTQE
ncbi:MAG: hypothetical protein J0M17_16360 [Planctomycetes bacterium]|nr:hypothetical protein [Planctomycetota bacterium]